MSKNFQDGTYNLGIVKVPEQSNYVIPALVRALFTSVFRSLGVRIRHVCMNHRQCLSQNQLNVRPLVCVSFEQPEAGHKDDEDPNNSNHVV